MVYSFGSVCFWRHCNCVKITVNVCKRQKIYIVNSQMRCCTLEKLYFTIKSDLIVIVPTFKHTSCVVQSPDRAKAPAVAKRPRHHGRNERGSTQPSSVYVSSPTGETSWVYVFLLWLHRQVILSVNTCFSIFLLVLCNQWQKASTSFLF